VSRKAFAVTARAPRASSERCIVAMLGVEVDVVDCRDKLRVMKLARCESGNSWREEAGKMQLFTNNTSLK
jgi:hypothetical protein